MGIMDIKNKFGSVTKKFNKILDKGSELENKFKDKISEINDIKEDPSGKIIEKIREKYGIDDISFGDISIDFNNPLFVKEQNQYNQKAESFSSFVKPGIPHLVFKVETEKSVTTQASKNAEAVLGKMMGVGGGVQISQANPNVQKQFKIPIDPSFLGTSYTFNFSQYNAKSDIDFSKSLEVDAKVEKMIQDTALNVGTNYLKNRAANSEFAKAASLQSGVAINPNMENAFTGVDFRNLSFSFELIPKNENQAIEMQKIVHLIKYWSHPDTIKNSNGKLLMFPYNWSIYYNDGQGGTTGVSFKTKLCYCNNIKIEYGNTNGYILMRDNSPSCVKISLSFTENAYITKEDIGTSYTNGGNY